MGEFTKFDAEAPATLGAVAEAVTHLITLSEAKILELVSAGKVADGSKRLLGPTSAAAFDSLRQPLLDLALEPAQSALTEFDSLREALLRLHPINHRPT
jgi:hypothetical protein